MLLGASLSVYFSILPVSISYHQFQFRMSRVKITKSIYFAFTSITCKMNETNISLTVFNPSNDEATFVQSTRMFWKTI